MSSNPVAAALLMLLPVAAHGAGRRARPLFEPTDVELEKAGVAELDLQFGFVEGNQQQPAPLAPGRCTVGGRHGLDSGQPLAFEVAVAAEPGVYLG